MSTFIYPVLLIVLTSLNFSASHAAASSNGCESVLALSVNAMGKLGARSRDFVRQMNGDDVYSLALTWDGQRSDFLQAIGNKEVRIVFWASFPWESNAIVQAKRDDIFYVIEQSHTNRPVKNPACGRFFYRPAFA